MSTPPIAAILARAADLLGRPVTLVGAPLPTASRNLVLRVRSGDGTSLILKQHLVPGPVHPSPEFAALEAFSAIGSDLTPKVVAHDDDLVVMTDLGSHPNVADQLLGADPLGARRAVLAWGTGLGQFHADSLRAKTGFEQVMVDRHGGFVRHLQEELMTCPDVLAQQLADWQVDVPDLSELAVLPGRFTTDIEVLSAGDMCPDNNLLTGQGVRFIDLEFATVHHVAWDLAYLYVPWPSCWCAWQLPAGLADEALTQWRTSFGYSQQEWPSLLSDIEIAADGWRWLSTSWLLPGLVTPWPQRPERPTPPVADRLCHTLDALAVSTVLPQLRTAAAQLAAAIRDRFTVAPLEVLGRRL